DEMEERAMAYIRKIDDLGGIVRAVEDGYPQREIANSAYQFQRAVDAGDRVIVGVNRYATSDADKIPTLKIDSHVEKTQIARVQDLRARRDVQAVERATTELRRACRGNDVHKDNVMVAVLDAVRASVTLGEVCDIFREEFGVHRDPAFL
ncbi:MAG TPA: methylmalonyl-CoA mutase family protein, partial [Pseudomonadota bacterium]|nr:methylmalonyl-CoA mutase family protein [Pseudomonadota bacterium]